MEMKIGFHASHELYPPGVLLEAVHRAEGSWSTTEPGSMSLVDRHTARG